ncbi:PAS domain S-box protein [Niastella sp. OAS944]|uniref:PAS domain S-box protein n=1 Tax=Niastella sp. OAS944 TaxID=2664089 RepID=UPI0035C8397E|nr:PAS domain S-box-containing protein [Chitinophagaceae bacterium OAS944]
MQSEFADLEFLINSIPALVAYIDCNMVLQFCNRPFKSWFGINGNPAGQKFQLIAGSHIFDQVQRHLGKILVGDCAHFEILVNTQNGIQYLEATLSPDFDQFRQVKGFLFHCLDITEKSKTERALKDYFENASICLHWVNGDGIIVWANLAELNLLGYTEDEYIGRHISEFHVNKSAIEDIMWRLTNKQRIENYDTQLICKDGSIKHVTLNSSALWEGEKFVHTRCFTIDVTEQKLAAKKIKESEERFRQMANLVPLVIWSTDENGDCNFLSSKWEHLTGKSVEEGLKALWFSFIHPDDRGKVVTSWMSSFRANQPFEGKFRFLNASGDYIVAYANASPIYDNGKKVLGYIGILQDISAEEQIKYSLEKMVLDRTEDVRKRNLDLKQAKTVLKKKNEELEKINNQLSSFAHIASHDLQEPLRKIQLNLGKLFAMDGEKISEEGKDLYRRIIDSTSRMRNLIQDLLTYARSNDYEGKLEEVDLNSILKETINTLDTKIAEKNATIRSEKLPIVTVVPFQFHQLFLNLLSNALKFAKPDKQPYIQVSCELVEGSGQKKGLGDTYKSYYHISVSDNGIGFSPELSEKIFEMFYRLHGRAKYEGTGLGLAICKKIVENHQGTIFADSREHEGSVFHIYLPNKK